jgi:hypothetical protein
MNKVLQNIQYVIKNSAHARLNESKLNEFCDGIKKEEIVPMAWKTETFYNQGSFGEQINYAFLFNSLNFCFWSDARWRVDYKNRSYEGSSALFASLTRALEDGIPLLDPGYVQNLDENKFRHILRGENEIPLLKERFEILKNNAAILLQNFDGDFLNLIEEAGRNCVKIVDLLDEYFPSFDDKEDYRGQSIYFNKRAQLAAKYSYEIARDFKDNELKDYDQLTAGAEYKIPAVLRDLDILEYSESLVRMVDGKTEISAGSEEEIEIRAFSVQAIELIKAKLNERGFGLSSPEIHTFIWFKGKKSPQSGKPHHRTLTIWY